MVSPVNVLMGLKEISVRTIPTSVPVSHVRMEAHVTMESIVTHVPVKTGLKGISVRLTQMNVPVILVKMVGNVQMQSMGIIAHVYQDLQVSEIYLPSLARLA